jgi:hypothetical protein
MNLDNVLSFLRTQRHAVQASVTSRGLPQTALVGVAFTDHLEIVFDTLSGTRKFANLHINPYISFVIGGWEDGNERTVQYQGIADFPDGAELQRLQAIYFEAFPQGRARLEWPDIAYVRVRPVWLRYNDYRKKPAVMKEIDFQATANFRNVPDKL